MKDDIFRGVNDNTAAAVKAGELIASGRRADGKKFLGVACIRLSL